MFPCLERHGPIDNRDGSAECRLYTQLRRIEQVRVVGFVKSAIGVEHVAHVALFDLVIELIPIDDLTAPLELTRPPLHPRLAVGLDEEFDVGIGADFRPDIAPIEHRADDVRLPDRLFEASPEDLEVTIEVAPAAMPLLVDYIPDGATSTEVGGRIRTTLRVSHFHGLKRLIASMPGVATVVAPPSARAAVAEWAASGAARYR